MSGRPNDMLFVPLYSTRGKLLGIISVDNPYDRQRPTRRSVEPLEIYAQQAAIAIENLSLLREARDQAAQMTALARASAAAVSTLDLSDLAGARLRRDCRLPWHAAVLLCALV